MSAEQFMNPRPVVLKTDDTIAEAARKIMAKQRRSLPVVDPNGRFQGMVTVSCLLHMCLPAAATTRGGLDSMRYVNDSMEDVAERLKQHMDEPVVRCLKKDHVAVVHPDTPTAETLLILYRANANLPVVDKHTNMLVGMISYYDVGAEILKVAGTMERV